MTDLLSSGPDTPGRRGTKVVVLLLCLLAVVALVIEHAGGKSHSRRPLAAVPSRTPSPFVTTRAPVPTPVESSPAQQDQVHALLQGIPGTPPRDTVLLLGGTRPTTVGGRPGQFAQVPLRPGEAVSTILPAKDGFVVAVQHPMYLVGQPSADLYFVATGGRVTHLTADDDFVLGLAGDRVFAIRYGSIADDATAAQRRGTVTEIAVTGHLLRRHTVAAELRLVADTNRGLLVTSYGGGMAVNQLQLLDPATMAIRGRITVVGAVFRNGDWIGWTPPYCTSLCSLTVVNARDARPEFVVSTPPDFFAGAFAMSPDRRTLAVSYFGRHPEGKLDAAGGYVEVITLATGHRQRVPGVQTAEKQTADLAWTPDGRSLAIGVGLPDRDERAIALWPAHGGRLRVLPRRYPGASQPSALVAL